jgi:hypothetical protein
MGHGFNGPCSSRKCCCRTFSLPKRMVGSMTTAMTTHAVTADNPNPRRDQLMSRIETETELIRSDPLFKYSYGREGGENIWHLFVLVLGEGKYDGTWISWEIL